MRKDSPVLFFIILIGLLALGIGVVIYLQNIVPDTIKSGSSADELTKADRRCLEVVKAGLRDAARAKFSSQKVVSLGKSRYQSTGNVDAPNATGILVRGNYSCIFNSSTKSFDLLSLEGGDIWTPLKK
jgi:hypothetical protein